MHPANDPIRAADGASAASDPVAVPPPTVARPAARAALPLASEPRRVLVIDDNSSIHDDFRRILAQDLADGPHREQVRAAAGALFGAPPVTPRRRRTDRSGAFEAFELSHAMTGRAGLELVERAAAEGRPFELAFVDMRMPPGWDGIETIRRIWQADEQIQTCICTAHCGRSWSDVLSELGASDRLLILKKPFDLIEIRQIAVALSEKWRMSRRAEAHVGQLEQLVRRRNADLAKALVVDRLTELPNRRAFQRHLAEAVERARGEGDYHFGLIFIDIDRFKAVNDAVGEAGGDELLRQVARRLRDAVRATDRVGQVPDPAPGEARDAGNGVVDVAAALDAGAEAAESQLKHTAARIGGDEFVVLLDEITADADAELVAERLAGVLAAPYDVGGRAITLSSTFGVTTGRLDYATAEEALRDADAAAACAKSTARAARRALDNTDETASSERGHAICVFSEAMRAESKRRQRVEHDLRGASGRDELRVLYQPIVYACDGTLSGFEALVRWQHPEDGLLGPGAFIDTAEECGLIGELGAWVLDHAAEAFAGWRRSAASDLPLTLNVNVSRQQLLEDDVVERAKALADRLGLDDGGLKLEVTEGGVMENPEESVRRLRALRDAGIRVVMDDFGTGYSSLACLHQFPLDCVKLDRSFIRQLGEKDEYAAVIEAIVTLTRALGIDLVAEGVETARQWDVLRELGCDLLQGYFFGKPLPAEDARGLVAVDRGLPVIDGRAGSLEEVERLLGRCALPGTAPHAAIAA